MGKRSTLMQDFQDLRESGSSSDFPNLLGSLMYRTLVDWARSGVPDVWRTYTVQGDLTDFRPVNRILGSEAEDLSPIAEDGFYPDSKITDAAYQVQLGTYGKQFGIGRVTIINDDLNYIKRQPQRFGRASARSIAKFVAQTLLEGNLNTYDGNALFSVAHGNLATGAGSALSAANMQTGITGLSNQTIFGVFTPVMARYGLFPTALKFTALQIINSALIIAAGGDATAGIKLQTIGNANVLENAVGILVDPFLTSTTAWYLLADPNDVPIIDVGFLNGKQQPDLLVEAPTMVNLAGGQDDYELDFDVIHYKVRFDYGGATALWWGGTKFAGA